jgi:hypothetical protein
MAVINGLQAPIFSLPWGREKISRGNRKKEGFEKKSDWALGAILFGGEIGSSVGVASSHDNHCKMPLPQKKNSLSEYRRNLF